MTRKIKFYPQNCIDCLVCMTIEDCRSLINGIRHGEPLFDKDNKCNESGCTKCIDICTGGALTLR